MRPVLSLTVLRSDTSLASYENGLAQHGLTVATMLTAAYRIPSTGGPGTGLAPLVRLALVTDSPLPNARGGTALVNPLLGVGYAVKTDFGMRFNAFFGATVPVGAGGGNSPDAGTVAARQRGLNARAQLDNALFAVNDFTVIPGLSAAYVAHDFTAQAEITLLHLMRVRGERAQPEASKTNLTMGLHLGYFLIPELSIGSELRYQRWLNAPFAVEKDPTDVTRDNLTGVLGPRAHFKVGDVWLRPGISYGRGLDKPLSAPGDYHFVQFDLPAIF